MVSVSLGLYAILEGKLTFSKLANVLKTRAAAMLVYLCSLEAQKRGFILV